MHDMCKRDTQDVTRDMQQTDRLVISEPEARE